SRAFRWAGTCQRQAWSPCAAPSTISTFIRLSTWFGDRLPTRPGLAPPGAQGSGMTVALLGLQDENPRRLRSQEFDLMEFYILIFLLFFELTFRFVSFFARRTGGCLALGAALWGPAAFGGPPEHRTLAVGAEHGCALSPTGTVMCWGHGD